MNGIWPENPVSEKSVSEAVKRRYAFLYLERAC